MNDLATLAPLGYAEVSAMTGVKIDTLKYWRHMGAGPRAYKVGRRVRFDRADVEAWLDEQRAAARTS